MNADPFFQSAESEATSVVVPTLRASGRVDSLKRQGFRQRPDVRGIVACDTTEACRRMRMR